jgi:putative peptidoglycan lipid II flippase
VADTSVEREDWSSATHYKQGQLPVEPRMFTEADPMAGMLPGWDGGGEDPWGSTTYIGRPRGKAPARPTPGSASTVDAGDLSTAEPAPSDGVDADSNRGMLANSRSMAVASLTSRVTGFVRSVLIVSAIGIAGVGNGYNSGNNFPNMVYELLLGGVLSSVLIPLLVHAQSEDADGGVAYTQRLLSIATAALGALTLLAVLAAPWIAAAFAPPGTRDLTSIFATLLLPEIFFYGLGAMFMAVLNIRHSYAAGAWAPVLNNIIMIVTVLVFWMLPGPAVLTPGTITTPQILVLGIGTTLGIAAQALVLIPALRRSGFHWEWRFRARPNEVGRMREVGTLAGWVLAYVVSSQIGVSVIQYVGSHDGGFSVFTQADLLFQMPYGILVVSLLTAIMPRLSRAAVRGDNAAVLADLSLGARLSAVALIPVTAGLIVLGTPLGVTLFAHGRSGLSGAELIGTSLALSAFGLFPFALVMLQLRVFYAMRDGRTPTLINVAMVGVKVALVLVSDSVYRAPRGTNVLEHPSVHAVEWLNIATSASYVVGAVVGHIMLTRRLGRLGFGRVGKTVLQIGAASVVGGLAAWGVVLGSHHLLGAARTGSLVGLAAGGVIGLGVLAVILWRMRLPDVREVVNLARR